MAQQHQKEKSGAARAKNPKLRGEGEQASPTAADRLKGLAGGKQQEQYMLPPLGDKLRRDDAHLLSRRLSPDVQHESNVLQLHLAKGENDVYKGNDKKYLSPRSNPPEPDRRINWK